MKGARVIEHTADIGLEAEGADLSEAFSIIATSMCGLIVNTGLVAPHLERLITLEGGDRGDLLVDLLTELLYIYEVEGLAFCVVDVVLRDGGLDAVARGERLDPQRHEISVQIKAVTYHMLEASENPPYARVLFDI